MVSISYFIAIHFLYFAKKLGLSPYWFACFDCMKCIWCEAVVGFFFWKVYLKVNDYIYALKTVNQHTMGHIERKSILTIEVNQITEGPWHLWEAVHPSPQIPKSTDAEIMEGRWRQQNYTSGCCICSCRDHAASQPPQKTSAFHTLQTLTVSLQCSSAAFQSPF